MTTKNTAKNNGTKGAPAWDDDHWSDPAGDDDGHHDPAGAHGELPPAPDQDPKQEDRQQDTGSDTAPSSPPVDASGGGGGSSSSGRESFPEWDDDHWSDPIDDDGGSDGGSSGGSDGGSDGGTDGGSDSGTDGGSDSAADSGTDGGSDSGTDSGSDGGSDSGSDSGSDGGSDSGTDSGSDGDGAGDTTPAFITVRYPDGTQERITPNSWSAAQERGAVTVDAGSATPSGLTTLENGGENGGSDSASDSGSDGGENGGKPPDTELLLELQREAMNAAATIAERDRITQKIQALERGEAANFHTGGARFDAEEAFYDGNLSFEEYGAAYMEWAEEQEAQWLTDQEAAGNVYTGPPRFDAETAYRAGDLSQAEYDVAFAAWVKSQTPPTPENVYTGPPRFDAETAYLAGDLSQAEYDAAFAEWAKADAEKRRIAAGGLTDWDLEDQGAGGRGDEKMVLDTKPARFAAEAAFLAGQLSEDEYHTAFADRQQALEQSRTSEPGADLSASVEFFEDIGEEGGGQYHGDDTPVDPIDDPAWDQDYDTASSMGQSYVVEPVPVVTDPRGGMAGPGQAGAALGQIDSFPGRAGPLQPGVDLDVQETFTERRLRLLQERMENAPQWGELFRGWGDTAQTAAASAGGRVLAGLEERAVEAGNVLAKPHELYWWASDKITGERSDLPAVERSFAAFPTTGELVAYSGLPAGQALARTLPDSISGMSGLSLVPLQDLAKASVDGRITGSEWVTVATTPLEVVPLPYGRAVGLGATGIRGGAKSLTGLLRRIGKTPEQLRREEVLDDLSKVVDIRDAKTPYRVDPKFPWKTPEGPRPFGGGSVKVTRNPNTGEVRYWVSKDGWNIPLPKPSPAGVPAVNYVVRDSGVVVPQGSGLATVAAPLRPPVVQPGWQAPPVRPPHTPPGFAPEFSPGTQAPLRSLPSIIPVPGDAPGVGPQPWQQPGPGKKPADEPGTPEEEPGAPAGEQAKKPEEEPPPGLPAEDPLEGPDPTIQPLRGPEPARKRTPAPQPAQAPLPAPQPAEAPMPALQPAQERTPVPTGLLEPTQAATRAEVVDLLPPIQPAKYERPKVPAPVKRAPKTRKARQRPRPSYGTFQIPSGAALPAGRYPHVVQWPQGNVDIRYDLHSGQHTVLPRSAPSTVTPQAGFRVLRTAQIPPRAHRRRLGRVDVEVSSSGIIFHPPTRGGGASASVDREEKPGRERQPTYQEQQSQQYDDHMPFLERRKRMPYERR